MHMHKPLRSWIEEASAATDQQSNNCKDTEVCSHTISQLFLVCYYECRHPSLVSTQKFNVDVSHELILVW